MTRIEERLEELRSEFERGRRHLELVERQRLELNDRLLRIGGAIQVLEELMAGPADAEATGEIAEATA